MNLIYPVLVPEQRRVDCAIRRFGVNFSTVIEPAVYGWASRLASSYGGGYWDFFCLCNGGFYMAPAVAWRFDVVAPNGHVGELSADALGLTACLQAFSDGSVGEDEALAATLTEQHHLLRAYVMQHRETGDILAASR